MKALQYRKVARSSALVALFSTRTETSSITGLPEALAAFVTQLDLVETLVKRQTQPLDLVLHARDAAFEAMVAQVVGFVSIPPSGSICRWTFAARPSSGKCGRRSRRCHLA